MVMGLPTAHAERFIFSLCGIFQLEYPFKKYLDIWHKDTNNIISLFYHGNISLMLFLAPNAVLSFYVLS